MSKTYQWCKRTGQFVVAGGSLVAMQARAAVPAAVEDALEAAGTDGAAIAGLVLLAIIAVFAVKLLRRGL